MVKDNDSKVNKADKFPSLLQFLLSQKRALEYDSAELRTSGTLYKSAVHYVAVKVYYSRMPNLMTLYR